MESPEQNDDRHKKKMVCDAFGSASADEIFLFDPHLLMSSKTTIQRGYDAKKLFSKTNFWGPSFSINFYFGTPYYHFY